MFTFRLIFISKPVFIKSDLFIGGELGRARAFYPKQNKIAYPEKGQAGLVIATRDDSTSQLRWHVSPVPSYNTGTIVGCG